MISKSVPEGIRKEFRRPEKPLAQSHSCWKRDRSDRDETRKSQENPSSSKKVFRGEKTRRGEMRCDEWGGQIQWAVRSGTAEIKPAVYCDMP